MSFPKIGYQISLLLCLSVYLFSCAGRKSESPSFAVLEDANYTALEVWEKFKDQALERNGLFNAGITPHIWWMKLELKPTDKAEDRHYLKLHNPHINKLEVYLSGSEHPQWVMGDNLPFDRRPYWDRDLIIPLILKDGESISMLLRVDKAGETLMVEPQLMSESRFLEKNKLETLFMGLIIGWMGVIFIAACLYAWKLRERSAIIYALYIISLTVWLGSHWGLGFQYLWPNSIDWVDKSRPTFNLLTNALFLFLILSFFPPLKKNSKLTYGIYVFIAIHVYLIIDSFIRPLANIPMESKMVFLRLIIVFSIFLTFLIILYLVRQIRAGIPYAGYYLAGIFVLIGFNVLIQLHQSGISLGMTSFVFDFGSSIGMLGETVFITVAFASRAANYKREKELLDLQLAQQEKGKAERLIQVQEEERNRIARDLHDSIGGMLSSIYLKASQIEENAAEPKLTRELKEMVSRSIEEARSISHNLTPLHLEEQGLGKTLKNQIDLIGKQHHLKINFTFDVGHRLEPATSLIVYRICGELLQNITKHARASEVMVSLNSDTSGLEIIVEDDGKGMNPDSSKNGIGLRNIRERVSYLKGNLHIDSNPSGTTVIITIPLPELPK